MSAPASSNPAEQRHKPRRRRITAIISCRAKIEPLAVMRLGGMLVVFAALSFAQAVSYRFEDAQALLKKYCIQCHQGSAPAGGFNLKQLSPAYTLRQNPERWN